MPFEGGILARLSRLPVIGNPAFKIADYRRLWIGAACNHLGMSGEQVVLSLLVFQITESTAWVGTLLAVYYSPLLVFGVVSGAVSDWLDRRTLLRGVELTIAANLGLFGALLAMGLSHLWLLLVFALVAGCLRATHQPLRSSYAYDIVGGEQVVAGLGLLSLGTRFGQLVGALMAGVVMQRLGTPAAFFALACVHGISFLLFSRLASAGAAAETERAPFGQNLREYLAEMRSNRVLLMLVLLTAAVEIFGFSFTTVLPELAASRFGLGAEGLGLMHAARALGGIVASLTLASVILPQRRGLLYLAVIFAFGGALLLLSAAEQWLLALAALILVASMAAASDVLTQSMIQLSVPNALRGRAMGAWTLAIGSAPLGHLVMGSLAVSVGVGSALFAGGSALLVMGLITAVAVPGLRRL